jgi:tripartite motif-containing protein 2/3
MEKVVCPNCREDTPVVDANVSKLFCNFQLLEAADAIKAHAAAESGVFCELCDDEQHAATHHCVQCAEFMCEVNAKGHRKSKVSRDHDVQTIAEFKSGAAAPRKASTRTVYCAAHPSPSPFHELTLFCKTCDVAICRDCIIEEHEKPAHDVVFLEKVIAEQRAVITEMATDAERRALVVGKAIGAIEAMQQSVLQQEAESEEAIKRTCQQVCTAARAHEAKMLVALKGGCAQKKKALGVQTEALGAFKAGLDSSYEYVRTALKSGSDAQIMHAKPLLMGRLRELQQQECVLVPAATEHIWVNTDTELVMSALEDLCIPHFPAVVAGRCTVEGAGVQGHPAVGREAKFTLTLNDTGGKCVVLPGDASGIVAVEARAAAGAGAGAGAGVGPDPGAAVAVVVTNGGDGSFTCKYTPADEAALCISVQVLGQCVPGSPFAVQPMSKVTTVNGYSLPCTLLHIVPNRVTSGVGCEKIESCGGAHFRIHMPFVLISGEWYRVHGGHGNTNGQMAGRHLAVLLGVKYISICKTAVSQHYSSEATAAMRMMYFQGNSASAEAPGTEMTYAARGKAMNDCGWIEFEGGMPNCC